MVFRLLTRSPAAHGTRRARARTWARTSGLLKPRPSRRHQCIGTGATRSAGRPPGPPAAAAPTARPTRRPGFRPGDASSSGRLAADPHDNALERARRRNGVFALDIEGKSPAAALPESPPPHTAGRNSTTAAPTPAGRGRTAASRRASLPGPYRRRHIAVERAAAVQAARKAVPSRGHPLPLESLPSRLSRSIFPRQPCCMQPAARRLCFSITLARRRKRGWRLRPSLALRASVNVSAGLPAVGKVTIEALAHVEA